MMLSVIALASGCKTISAAVDYCEHSRTIYWHDRGELDRTPINIVRQVVRHNERIDALCP